MVYTEHAFVAESYNSCCEHHFKLNSQCSPCLFNPLPILMISQLSEEEFYCLLLMNCHGNENNCQILAARNLYSVDLGM